MSDTPHLFDKPTEKKNNEEVFTIKAPGAILHPPPSKSVEKNVALHASAHTTTTKKTLKFIGDLLLNLIIIVGIIFVVRNYIFAPFQVSGPSMCDTFNFIENQCLHGNGEYLIINKIGYQKFFDLQIGEPARGDVIIFTPPNDEEKGEFFIKRIIGMPGETIKLKNGDVFIYNEEYPNGWELEESYLNATNQETFAKKGKEETFEIPEGQYFVMGDNRRASLDSRRCFSEAGCTSENTAYLSRELIEGKAWVVLWPFSSIRLIEKITY